MDLSKLLNVFLAKPNQVLPRADMWQSLSLSEASWIQTASTGGYQLNFWETDSARNKQSKNTFAQKMKITKTGQRAKENKLDQVCCAWLIKWVVKRKLFSWLNCAYRDDELKVVLDGTGSVYDDTGWYLVSISWNCLVLGGTGSAKGLYAFIYWKK